MDIKKTILQPVEVFLRKIIQRNNDEVYFIWDVNTRRLYFISESYEEIWERSSRRLYENGEEYLLSVHKDDHEKVLNSKVPLLHDESPVLLEYRIWTEKEECKWISEKRWPLFNEHEECVAWGWISKDITAERIRRIRMEEILNLQKKNEDELKAFFELQGNILNMYLKELIHMNQISCENALSPEMYHMTCNIHHQILKISRFVSDSQEYFHHHNNLSSCNTAFNLRSALESVHDDLSQFLASKDIGFTFHIDPTLKSSFVGDAERLKQSLRYLVFALVINFDKYKQTHKNMEPDTSLPSDHFIYPNINASKTSIEGLSKKENLKMIILEADQVVLDDNSSLLSIHIFMNEQMIEQQNLLNPLNENIILNYDNLYINLAKRILKRIGGKVSYEIEDMFKEFVLKVKFQNEIPTIKSVVNVPEITLCRDKKVEHKVIEKNPKNDNKSVIGHVLIVEDNNINQHLISIILSEIGCTSDVASEGKQALALCEKDYDLVFVDIGLPGMDGFEVAKNLRQRMKNKNIPIIGMSAHMSMNNNNSNLLNGLDDFIYKPFGISVIHELVEKWIINCEEKIAVG